MLGGQLVNRDSREEPVCLKYSERLVVLNVGARHSDQRGSSSYIVGARLLVLKGELVDEN